MRCVISNLRGKDILRVKRMRKENLAPCRLKLKIGKVSIEEHSLVSRKCMKEFMVAAMAQELGVTKTSLWQCASW